MSDGSDRPERLCRMSGEGYDVQIYEKMLKICEAIKLLGIKKV